jgi:hypothetical protein
MPSMKCHECKQIRRCAMVVERGEGDRDTPVYYCKPCLREIKALSEKADK